MSRATTIATALGMSRHTRKRRPSKARGCAPVVVLLVLVALVLGFINRPRTSTSGAPRITTQFTTLQTIPSAAPLK